MARDDDTNQMRGINIPDECAWCTKRIYKYNTPYSLSGEFTASRCGTKPQRLFN